MGLAIGHDRPVLRPVGFERIFDSEADCLGALAAFSRRATTGFGKSSPATGFGVDASDLDRLAVLAGALMTEAEARAFLRHHFRPMLIEASGHATAFFEPSLPASPVADQDHPVPIYRRPAELVRNRAVAPGAAEPGYGVATADGTIIPFHDRSAIETGALSGRGLELAWLKDPVDAFFLHVQGAGRLEFPDASAMRITFDGKSGHAFTAIGRILVRTGELDPASVSMQTISDWLRRDPARAKRLMWRNRSYIFFRQAGDADDPGPVAAAKVPLTPLRSIAVDMRWHTLGSLFFLDIERFNEGRLQALVTAQDTGSAIVGPARIDVFCGTGVDAAIMAGAVNSPCTLVLLQPVPSVG